MKVGIVGLGYVGLPLAVAFAEAGAQVVGVDIDGDRTEALARGESDIEDIPSTQLRAVGERLSFGIDPAALAEADAVLICVPTPLTINREPDLAPLLSASKSVGSIVRAGQLVVLESTTYPGTTRERLLPALEASGLTAGEDFHVAFSPERVDPGSRGYSLRNTPKVVGGLTEACADRAEELYRMVCDEIVRVSTPEVAELSKLLENIFRSVNIALVNELAILAHRMDIDIWEVVDAAATKPFGFMRFDPGPGMGGHCLPVDPFYLSWKAREYDFALEFIELAGKLNQRMPYVCVQRVIEALNAVDKSVHGSDVLLLGVSYKPGVSDTRESPALKIAGLLLEQGAELSYHDPHVPALAGFDLHSVELGPAVAKADIVVVVTAHPEVDHDAIVRDAALVLDLRGVTAGNGDSSAVRL
ncbi:MAG TPA: nucleotide sugar dehydrogenase [Solirubrobacteraceae bacterium]